MPYRQKIDRSPFFGYNMYRKEGVIPQVWLAPKIRNRCRTSDRSVGGQQKNPIEMQQNDSQPDGTARRRTTEKQAIYERSYVSLRRCKTSLVFFLQSSTGRPIHGQGSGVAQFFLTQKGWRIYLIVETYLLLPLGIVSSHKARLCYILTR